ncbi:MAG: DNA polymerase III subunit alpha [Candidatus Delongbacteria bacterium]
MSFVHLHNHSHYSTLDGLSKPKDMIKTALDHGQKAMAITDHGNLMGVLEFYQEAVKNGIKPIIGSEFYIVKDRKVKEKGEKKYHLVLLAKDQTGYKNLLILSTESNINHFYGKPRIDRELLEAHHEGLIALSACLAGEIPQAIIQGNIAEAEQSALWYKSVMGKDNFYLEIQDHPGLKDQERVNKELIRMSRDLEIGLAATNDSHYVNKEDDIIQDALVCINTGKRISEKEGRLCMLGENYSIRSTQDMKSAFKDVPEALENTVKIADACDLKIEFDRKLLPHFECPQGYSQDDYLEFLCVEGLEKRYGIVRAEEGYSVKEEYYKKKLPVALKDIISTLEFELKTVKNMGFPGYFLIVQDFVNWAKKNGVLVGPGRGSAAGSLISFLTGITNIDPLKYGLLFERFLNPDRISMPDIDIDFQDDKRDMVMSYVREKYGEDNVCQVVTYQTMGAKNSIRDIGRVLGTSIDDVNKISSLVPSKPNIKISSILKEGEFKKFYDENSRFQELIDMANRIEGTIRGTGTHACAVIISSVPAFEIVPLQYPPREKHTVITQYEGTQLDNIGLLKMDFLGIRNLTIISHTAELIKKNKNIKLDLDNLPFDDKKTFKLYSKGVTNGVFQFESPGMKKYLKDLKPNRFEDLVAMNALFRPGPMQYIPEYINRKHKRSPVTYDHPLMEKYLKDTYGITVYQEQVMLLSRELAGFSRGESDNLRKAMGKKIRDMMSRLKEKFLSGCLNNPSFISKFKATKEFSDPKTLAKKIWKDWENFAEYAFNKSHAVCYAYVSYITAYLKANYPVEFMSSMLNSVKDKSDEVLKYIEECEKLGIRIMRPDVNSSQKDFAPAGKNRITFGLQAIKNVGAKAIESIVNIREESGKYTSIFDFLERIDISKANRRVVEHLAMAGALDSLGHNRSQIVESLEVLLPHFQEVASKKADWEISLFADSNEEDLSVDHPPLPAIEEWDKVRMLENEKELIGLYVSGHPLDEYLDVINSINTKKAIEPENFMDEEQFTIGGMIRDIIVRVTRNGNEMARVLLILPRGDTEINLFPKTYEKYKDIINEGEIFFFRQKVSKRNGDFRLFVEEIFDYAGALEKFNNGTKKIRINITPSVTDKDMIDDFMDFISKNKGDKDLYFKIVNSDSSVVLKSDSYKVKGSLNFIKGIKKILGEESVEFC